MKPLFFLTLIALLSGCGESPAPPPKEIESVLFAGVKLPGRATDAKAAGFTDCTEDYYNFTCQAKTFNVLGISPAKATLFLNGRAVFAVDRTKVSDASGDVRLLPVQKLAYDEVRLDLPRAVYDEECVARTKRDESYRIPSACLKPGNSIENLREKLQKADWVKINARRHDVFLHPNEEVSIKLHNDSASISRVEPAYKASELEKLARLEVEAKAKADAGRAHVESMAK